MKSSFVVFQQWGKRGRTPKLGNFPEQATLGNKRDKILRRGKHSQSSKYRVLEASHGGCQQESKEHLAVLAPALHVCGVQLQYCRHPTNPSSSAEVGPGVTTL